ncbi:MAG: DsbA family protein [Hyphomicrobiales bacterium]|nr:DsbA family protein [Hyphomicrobiales bacterium]
MECALQSREQDYPTRRELIGGALAGLAAITVSPGLAFAQQRGLFPITGDDRQPVMNYRIPAELSAFKLPGILWAGPKNADVVLFEFFDYNCPWCHRAEKDLQALLKSDRNLRLGLVNNAILSVGSYQAARVQQSVLRLYGPAKAFEFHKRLFQRRGRKDGLSALALVKSMGLDRAAVEKSGDSDIVGNVVMKQTKHAASLAFNSTPSYILNGVGLLGFPGSKTLRRMIAAVRKCDEIVCK